MKEFGYFNVAKSIIYIPLIKVYPLIYVRTKQDLRERDFSLKLILSDTCFKKSSPCNKKKGMKNFMQPKKRHEARHVSVQHGTSR